jgi:hypothetical protein
MEPQSDALDSIDMGTIHTVSHTHTILAECSAPLMWLAAAQPPRNLALFPSPMNPHQSVWICANTCAGQGSPLDWSVIRTPIWALGEPLAKRLALFMEMTSQYQFSNLVQSPERETLGESKWRSETLALAQSSGEARRLPSHTCFSNTTHSQPPLPKLASF